MEPTVDSIKDLESAASGTQVDLSTFLDWVPFNEQGLVPAIAQDHTTGNVLMLAWMNREAIEQTLTLGKSSIFLAAVKRCGVRVRPLAIRKAWSLCDSTATLMPFCSQSTSKARPVIRIGHAVFISKCAETVLLLTANQ